eukprot:GEMP01006895.1.p1 GENE.GEMP01006895.1~~GEMP01006895.1.p1  ORF type:complete len:1181 (+),score=301.97 GEMP01006895.1:146-3688(+)
MSYAKLEGLFRTEYAGKLRREHQVDEADCEELLKNLMLEIKGVVKKHGTNGDGYSVKLPDNILDWKGEGCNARTGEDAMTLMYYNALRKNKIDAPEPDVCELVTQTGTTDSDMLSLRTSVKDRKAKAKQTEWDEKWDPCGDKDPRPYQRESVERLMKESLLINMPTGSGKTLVAVMAANYFMAMDDKKCVAFFVPTRALVEQQAEYMRDYCRVNGKQIDGEMVKEVAGMDVGDWDKNTWRNTIDNAKILVGTPEVFRKSMCDTHFVSPQDFSLLIFDEAHHCVRNSPMANILRCVKGVDVKETRPHRLGLTGSWLNGALRNADEKLRILLDLMEAEMFVPDIDPALLGSEAIYNHVMYEEPDGFLDMEELVGEITADILEGLETICKESDKAKRRSTNVFKQLGLDGWKFYLRYGLIEETRHQAKNHIKCPSMKEFASKKLMSLDTIAKSIEGRMKTNNARIEQLNQAAPSLSGKVNTLLILLKGFVQQNATAKIIVFVEEVSVSLPLMWLINQHVHNTDDKTKDLPIATYSTGVNSLDDESRKANIKGYKEGKYRIMVATASLEEGLDVAACNHVISYDGIATVKSHIQKSGRARAADAHIWYFENDPEVEKLKQSEMEKTAQRQQANVGPKVKPKAVPIYEFNFGYYPYKDPSSEMTIQLLNCKTIFHEYAQAVFRQEISPFEMLYVFSEEKRVVKVRVPTPDGVKMIQDKEVVEIWGSQAVCNDPKGLRILHPEAKKEMKDAEWELRKFVMSAVIWLQRQGHMQDNKASDKAKWDTRKHPDCLALLPKDPQTKFRNMYGSTAQANAQNTGVQSQPNGYRAAQANAENTGTSPSPNAPPRQAHSKNFREQLTEAMQRQLRVPLKKDSIVFRSQKHSEGWLSTVTITTREGVAAEVFCGTDPKEMKRNADEDVAYIALTALNAKNTDGADEPMANVPESVKMKTTSNASPDASEKSGATPTPVRSEDTMSMADTACSFDDNASTGLTANLRKCTVNPQNDDNDDAMSMKTCTTAALTYVPTPTKEVARAHAPAPDAARHEKPADINMRATTLSSLKENGESVVNGVASQDVRSVVDGVASQEEVRMGSESSERESGDDAMLVEVNLCYNTKKRKVDIPGTRTVGDLKREKIPTGLKDKEGVVLQDEGGRELDDGITLAQLQRERSRSKPLELEFTVNDW